jgi:hypothetical protein
VKSTTEYLNQSRADRISELEHRLISEDADTRKAAVVAAKKLAEKRSAASFRVKQLQEEAESLGLVGYPVLAGIWHPNLGLQTKSPRDAPLKKVRSIKLMTRCDSNLHLCSEGERRIHQSMYVFTLIKFPLLTTTHSEMSGSVSISLNSMFTIGTRSVETSHCSPMT